MNQKNIKGFSILDLITSIAIVAILASVAVPNYKLFKIKAKVGIVKTHLADVYRLEKIYFIEFNAFSARLDQLGFNPDGTLMANIGFAVDFAFVPPNAPTGSATCIRACQLACAPSACNPPIKWACGFEASQGFDIGPTPPTFATNNSFRVQGHAHFGNTGCASNNLDNIYTLTVDQNNTWTVNPNGN